ncbi:MAG: serine dehydratase subunit alpha family protein [Zetaproteobacteria bacterium]|nr:MAG: serine dehydratase subunit alpha family protein [Zetaproteobacteria bacterium]
MNILKQVLTHEVFPAFGCTEPIAVAYAASLAGCEAAAGRLERLFIVVDPGVYKNGLAVAVPNTDGEHGNPIAGVLGALIKRPELKMEILTGVTPELLAQAKAFVRDGRVRVACDSAQTELFVEVRLQTTAGSARAILRGGHTNVVLVEKDGLPVFEAPPAERTGGGIAYRQTLKAMSLAELIDAAEAADAEDLAYIRRGIEMNLAIAEAGTGLKRVGYYLDDLVAKGYLHEDVFSSSKRMTAAAADARMAGMSYPVMASGGSGNQGVVAILVPYNVGKHFKIPDDTVLTSIAFSHLLNAYIKCFTGDLAPICGCAIAAGVGAAAAIVYQQAGKDLGKIGLAVNTLISDLGGMLCDGAKGGCALKVVSSTDAAIRAAYMALNGHGITAVEGFVGRTAEETIRNLSRISEVGMAKVDDTMIEIMMEKAAAPPPPETPKEERP